MGFISIYFYLKEFQQVFLLPHPQKKKGDVCHLASLLASFFDRAKIFLKKKPLTPLSPRPPPRHG
jgi:hypothetical protein